MTYEEAIRQAENRLTHIRMMRSYYRCAPSIITNTIDFLKVAKEALEKQIPEFPVRDEEYVFTWLWCCPRCGGRPMENYCANCGQAIDWSDDE